MPERRVVRSLGIEREGQAFFFSYQEDPPADGQFRLDTLYTGLSAGTELSFFKGSNPYLRARWDDDFGVFVEGEPSIRFPIPFLGYMEVGRVSESRAPTVPEGWVVAMTYGHKTGHTADALHDFWVPLPPELDPILGIYVAQMGPICANGLLHAAADARGETEVALRDGVRGRCVLVTGAGAVGLLTALWARQLGAEVVAVADPTPARLAAAEALGLVPVDDADGAAWRWIKDRWRHGAGECGADVVFQCRGRTSALATALRALRPQGTVIDLAFYEDGAAELRLGEEFHHNGLSIRCAQISRVPRGLAPLWGRLRLAGETVAFLQDCGKLVVDHIVTDVVPFDEAPDLLADLAAHDRASIQAVFEVAT